MSVVTNEVLFFRLRGNNHVVPEDRNASVNQEQLFVCWLFCFRSSQSIGHGTSRPCHKRWACHFFPPMGRWAEVLCSNGKVWPVCRRVNFGCNIVIVFCNVAGKTIAGTTDTPTELSFNPLPKEAEIQFILSEIRHYLSPDVDGE